MCYVRNEFTFVLKDELLIEFETVTLCDCFIDWLLKTYTQEKIKMFNIHVFPSRTKIVITK